MSQFAGKSVSIFRLAVLAVFAYFLSGIIPVFRDAPPGAPNNDLFRVGVPYTYADAPPVGSSGGDTGSDGSGAGSGEGSSSASGSACDGSAGCSAGGTGSSSTY